MSPAETLAFRPTALPPLSRLLVAAAVRVLEWETRHRTRKALARLDSHALRDVGLDALSAEAEATRPFWRD